MGNVVLTHPIVPISDATDPFEEYRLDQEIGSVSRRVEELRREKTEALAQMESASERHRPHFPKILTNISIVEGDIAVLQEELQDILEARAAKRRAENGKDDSAYEPESDPEPEVHDQESYEDKKLRKNRKKAVQKFYRRICALCHPDKTLGLEAELIASLREIFLRAKVAYLAQDLETMTELYATAMATRSGKTAEEIEEDKRQKLKMLQHSLSDLLSELVDIKQHPLYVVYDLERQGQKGNARSVYGQVLAHILNQKDSERSALRQRIANMKENDSWTSL